MLNPQVNPPSFEEAIGGKLKKKKEKPTRGTIANLSLNSAEFMPTVMLLTIITNYH